MQRLARTGILALLLLSLWCAAGAQASTLTGTVVWVNPARHTTGVRDSHRRVHVLRYRGQGPTAHHRASFSLRRGYVVLLSAHVAAKAPRTKPIGTTTTTTTTATSTIASAPVVSSSTSLSSTVSSSTASAPSSVSSTSATSVAPTSTTTSSTTTSSPASTTSNTATTSASSSTNAAASVPQHIETWSYDDGCNGGKGASSALVQSWLTYAESSCGTSATKAQSDCHTGTTPACSAFEYLDAEKIYAQWSVPIASVAQENWWLHQPGYTDSAHRLAASDPTWGTANLLDQANPSVQSWMSSYARTNYSSYDGLMMDDTAPDLSQQFYGSGYSSSQEITTNSALLSSHEAMAAGMTKPDGSHFLQVDNSLSDNPWVSAPFALLGHGDGVQGFVAEGQPVSGGTLTKWYSMLLDDLGYIDYQPNAFIALLSYDSGGSLTARRLQAATVLLGYSPGHVVSWSDLEQSNSNLTVWPEEGIYPTQAVQTMNAPGGSGCLSGNGSVCTSGGHNDVQVASGVYRREFRACFNRGVAIGPCAAIVNDTGLPVTVQGGWLTQSYRHQISMTGGDVQSGGSLDLTSTGFTAGATQVAANDAILLAS